MHFNFRAFFKTADSQKMRESENAGDFWSINLPRNDDKSNFRVCLCKRFGKIKAYRYRKKECGFDSIYSFRKMHVN